MRKAEEIKDIVEKEFIAFPDIAADVINVLLYQGERLTGKETLLAGPTETIYQGKKRLRNQYEDLCKYEMEDGVIKIMYLISNQSMVDGKMLLRKAGYIGGVYREQYEGKQPNIFPVIEFVLYWGKSTWRSGRNIRSLFRHHKLSANTWKYVDELKLHVFEIRHLPKETRQLFESDMRIVADFLAEGDSYRSDRKIVHKAALVRMIKVLSGDTDIEGIEEWMKEQEIREGDEITVCELFDQYERRGRAQGKAEGKAEERNTIIGNMLREGMDRDLIRKVTGCSDKELAKTAYSYGI